MAETLESLNELRPLLLKLARRWRGCYTEPEDLVQGFIAELGKRVVAEFDPTRGGFWPLVRISFVRYALNQAQRHNGRRETAASQFSTHSEGSWEFVLDRPKAEMSPEQQAIAKEKIQIVNLALRELSERDQDLLVLRYCCDMPLHEVTIVLNYPTPNAASAATRRASRRLALRLAKYFADDGDAIRIEPNSLRQTE